MINEKLKNILSKQFGIPLEKINDESHLVDDCGADSLDLLEIVLLIEHEFGIKIYEQEYEQALSVGKIVALITTKTKT
jgi:acyl carrier protein